MRQVVCVVVTILLIATIGVSSLEAAGRGEPGPVYRARIPVFGDDTALLALLHRLDIDVDGAFRDHVRVYVLEEEIEKLRALGIDVEVVAEPAPGTEGETDAPPGSIPAQYHTYETLTADLQTIAAEHPDIARLVSIGKSVQGRELWMMQVSADPDVESDEPEFVYLAAMHGDEVVGKEMAFHLIDYLTDHYGSDPRVTDLVDTTDIRILPSMNPDGTALNRRYNANWIDLNRDFPDQFVDPVNTPDGRAAETAAVMNWAAGSTTSLSANFHGGTLVANYPFDGNPGGLSVYSPTPDDDLFRSLARTYADNNPAMVVSNSHPSYENGVCNGADWYAVSGGLQDWSWVWRGDADLTLEISATKWPSASTLPGFWDDNLESMLAYMERVHEGLRGVVTDAVTGEPLAAEVHLSGNEFGTPTDPDVGDWHRVVLPGTYDLEISAEGHVTRLVPGVVVSPGPARRIDVALEPLATDLQAIAACAPGGSGCDPWLPGGSVSDLTVTLRNTGSDAASIVGTLEPTGWFADVTRGPATYPDLANGQTGDSDAPGHAVAVDPAAPVGHKVGFVLRWAAAEGSGVSDPWFLPVDAETCRTVDAAGLPLPVVDRSVTDSSVDVVDDLEVTTVRVAVDIRHTYRSDLNVEIVAPSGTAVTLHARSGGSADDLVGTYGDGLVPFEPFSRLTGESSTGIWTLRVDDGVPSNTGTLEAWSLAVCGRPFESTTPEMRIRDVARDGAGARLTWWPYPGLSDYRVYRSTDPSAPGSFVDVTSEDPDPTDTSFRDASPGAALYWLVTGVGPAGEGPKGHFGE